MADPVDVPTDVNAAYVFRVRFRLTPAEGVSVEPSTFETTLERAADPPGTPGWLFFRDNLWRGAVNDEPHMRDLASEALGLPVERVEFRELRTDRAYLDALEEAVAANLDLFRAGDTAEALGKYLGSSIHIRGADDV